MRRVEGAEGVLLLVFAMRIGVRHCGDHKAVCSHTVATLLLLYGQRRHQRRATPTHPPTWPHAAEAEGVLFRQNPGMSGRSVVSVPSPAGCWLSLAAAPP